MLLLPHGNLIFPQKNYCLSKETVIASFLLALSYVNQEKKFPYLDRGGRVEGQSSPTPVNFDLAHLAMGFEKTPFNLLTP